MIALAIIAALMLASAALALSRRNLIHSALLLIFTWAGIAAFYLWAGAEFIAFAQVLIYVGAVSMIVLFAVLLTRRGEEPEIARDSRRRVIPALIAGAAVAGVIGYAVLATPFDLPDGRAPAIQVRQLGFQLMGPQIVSLLVAGVVLTVALIGATILASTEPERRASDDNARGAPPEEKR
ncbi:MAG TPA: NADH-quinone oxidoreductase subunit J [Opitutus sp.]|nr:NADH-quinone oxidoreductase subunit J [Opitutus sp.]